MAREKPQLETTRLILRLPEAADAPALACYAIEERAFLAPWGPVRPDAYYTEDHWQQQPATQLQNFLEDKGLLLFAFDRENPAQVHGRVSFSNFVRGAFHACHLGYELRRRSQGKGLMHEALEAAIAYAFAELNLHRIQANYMPRNERSARVLEKLGFVIEGRARAYLLINGVWEDHVLTSLTNPRWRPPA
ncbi:MAG: GNAT family N-acetyltransferase [Planctomycetes bacterium]|nr:GNAT family N-acetyltransferase [Planctomycetota bacterium]